MIVLLSVLAALAIDPAPQARSAAVAPAPVVSPARDTREPILSAVAVTLECTARASGRVEDCKVLGETHPGLGFAEAAIALMRDAEVAPGPRDVQFARTIQFVP